MIEIPYGLEMAFRLGVTSCYTLIRGGMNKGALFRKNGTPLSFCGNHNILGLFEAGFNFSICYLYKNGSLKNTDTDQRIVTWRYFRASGVLI